MNNKRAYIGLTIWVVCLLFRSFLIRKMFEAAYRTQLKES